MVTVARTLTRKTLTTTATHDLLRQELRSIVNQLLGVSHFWVEVGMNIQGVDPQGVGGVTLFFRDEIKKKTCFLDGLDLLRRRNPVRQFWVGAEWFGHIGIGSFALLLLTDDEKSKKPGGGYCCQQLLGVRSHKERGISAPSYP